MNRRLLLIASLALFISPLSNAAVDWVGNMFPTTVNTTEGAAQNIFIQVYKAGVTESSGQGAGIICELYYGEVNNFGDAWMNISQLPMMYNIDIGNNDEYKVDIAVLEDGLYEYTCRCSDDMGSTWTFATLTGGNGQMTILEPLPLTLDNFTTQRNGPEILLQWSTISEFNTSHFEIEKSINATDWSAIGNIQANGFSSSRQTYSLTDSRPLRGLQYYRLKQIDVDGNFDYSAVRSIHFKQNELFDIYPNPVTDKLLFISSREEEWTQATIHDSNGHRVLIHQYTSRGIDLSGIPAGLYFLYVENELGISTGQKIIIQ